MKSAWAFTLSMILAAGTITACGGASSTAGNTASTAAPKKAAMDTLNIGLSADPPKLDPSLSSALVDRQVMIDIYDTLFQISSDNKIEPDLAKSYDVSADGKTYTLHLQTGVTFQDGTPFNAAAVKFNLERDLKPSSPRYSELSAIQSIDTPSESTVVIHLSKPYSPLPGVLSDRSGMMVSPTAVQKEGSDFVNHPVGTGPFKFDSRVTGDHITLIRNDHYWGGTPKFKTVTFKIFTDPNVEVTNLESGAVQFIDTVPAQQVQTLQQNSNFTVSNTPGLGYQGFYLNTKEAPFNNPYLRQAVDQAIDRSAIVSVLFKGTATPAYSPFSSASPAYNQAENTPPTPDATKIKQLLKEGGEPNGFKFSMEVTASPVTTQMAQIIQSMLQQYGIQMAIQQMEFGTVLANSDNHAFEASQLGWSGRYDPDQDIYSFYYTNGSLNNSQYSSQQVDSLLDEARAESNMSDRAKTYAQVMDIIHKDVPYVYLYQQNNVFAYSKQLKGFTAYPDGLIRVAALSLS